MEEKLLGRLVRLNTAYGMCELLSSQGPAHSFIYVHRSMCSRCFVTLVRNKLNWVAVSDHKENSNPYEKNHITY